ncbi:hypothetical protein KR054_003414, partial [Drosophila jambulina]
LGKSVSPMDSDSSVSAMSATSARSEKSAKGRRRGRPSSKSSAPTQAKQIALASMGVPEPVATVEELSSLEDPPSASAVGATKVRETWSAVVKCDDPALSGKAIAGMVRKMVAPALDVRVHEAREFRLGGAAIIRTPSVGELQKVVRSAKFAEVGLNVARNPAEKPKVVVYDVDTAIGPKKFMKELLENNFDDEMTASEFKKAVHMVTKPWSVTDGPTVNVTLEV